MCSEWSLLLLLWLLSVSFHREALWPRFAVCCTQDALNAARELWLWSFNDENHEALHAARTVETTSGQ